MIRDIESVYYQPGHDLTTIRVQGGSGGGVEHTIDRITADRYLNRLKREVSAIEETDNATLALFGLEDGERRLDAIRMLYINHTHTVDGIAEALHVSRRTAHYYRANYLHRLAQHLGYEQRK
jgi:FixJ family two-component response regulator